MLIYRLYFSNAKKFEKQEQELYIDFLFMNK